MPFRNIPKRKRTPVVRSPITVAFMFEETSTPLIFNPMLLDPAPKRKARTENVLVRRLQSDLKTSNESGAAAGPQQD
jgi:hypothetical protein